MKLGSASRYAIAALVQMARRPDALHAAHRLAAARGLSPQFMHRAFLPLLKSGLVYGTKGRRCGITAAPER